MIAGEDGKIAMAETFWALGLNSGTSLDGVDAALIRTDGIAVAKFGPWMTEPYSRALSNGLRALLQGAGDLATLEDGLTRAHANAARALLARHPALDGEIDVIGFSRQTVRHEPGAARSAAIGDATLLAQLTGIPVVSDFRDADLAAGGQGAPLVALYHAALATNLDKPVAVLNVGGIANVTWIGDAEAVVNPAADAGIVTFDIGPGVALIDDWALRHTGHPMDVDGALAARGRTDESRLVDLLDHDYFGRLPPKAMDRGTFSTDLADGLTAADGAATLTALTARACGDAARHFPEPASRWLVCGGGRHNPTFMTMLREVVGLPVDTVETVDWRGDAIEAEAFGFLAVRALKHMPLTPAHDHGRARTHPRRPRLPAGRREVTFKSKPKQAAGVPFL